MCACALKLAQANFMERRARILARNKARRDRESSAGVGGSGSEDASSSDEPEAELSDDY